MTTARPPGRPSGRSAPTAPSYTDAGGLAPATSYAYKVCAYAGSTESCSAAATGTTLPLGVVLPVTVVVDDRSPGFARSGNGWRRQSVGYRDRSYWTPVRSASTRQTASWTATLRAPGRYAVWVRIPVKHATTRSAVYRISTADGTRTRTISQRARAGTWALLGTYTFGSVARVRVSDRTGERTSTGRTLVVDAIKVVPAAP